jgi:2-iminoacetate synthase
MNKYADAEKEIFIDRDKLYSLVGGSEPSDSDIDDLLNKSLKLRGLDLRDVSLLLRIESGANRRKLLDAAGRVKREIYGKRLVLFAPLYTGNRCTNNCLYCAFRKDNTSLKRTVLDMRQIKRKWYPS